MEQCGTCRYFRVLKDETKKCRYKGILTKDSKGKCELYKRRWPDGISIPDLKESE